MAGIDKNPAIDAQFAHWDRFGRTPPILAMNMPDQEGRARSGRDPLRPLYPSVMNDHTLRVYDSILGLLSSAENPTPLVRLTKVVPYRHTQVYAKLEWYNP